MVFSWNFGLKVSVMGTVCSDWGENYNCLVWSQTGVVWCYFTQYGLVWIACLNGKLTVDG